MPYTHPFGRRRPLPPMRTPTALFALLMFFANAAHALTIDAKAMARFDVSYTACESRFPDMRGRRDEAYLSLWRVKADGKARAQLASVRKGGIYQAERKRMLRAKAQGTSPAASSPLEQQCQALRAETQRSMRSKP
jgi:hypothetical protein